MSDELDISPEDRELMTQYDINAKTRTVFYSEGYKYENLKDAVRYAKLSGKRRRTSPDE